MNIHTFTLGIKFINLFFNKKKSQGKLILFLKKINLLMIGS